MASLARLVGALVKGLALVRVAPAGATAPVPLEERAPGFGEGRRPATAIERDPFDQTLIFEVAQVVAGPPAFIARVAQVALVHDPKGADGREGPRLRAPE